MAQVRSVDGSIVVGASAIQIPNKTPVILAPDVHRNALRFSFSISPNFNATSSLTASSLHLSHHR